MSIEFVIETELVRSQPGKLVGSGRRYQVVFISPLGNRRKADLERLGDRRRRLVNLQRILFPHAPSMKHA